MAGERSECRRVNLIQTALIFLLGFLAAGFLAVLVAPAIWRRAVILTGRRLEAALPLTMAEIRADKDAVRAEYAMQLRRLEMTLKSLRQEKIAQALAIERAQSEARDAAQAFAAAEAARAGLEEQRQVQERKLESLSAEAQELAAELVRREEILAKQAAELKSLEAMYDEASLIASNRQIELVVQATNVDKMDEEVAVLNKACRQIEAKLRDSELQNNQQERALEEERRKLAALEIKNSKLLTSLSDVQERLERRERDLEHLRGRQEAGTAEDEAGIAMLRECIQDIAAEMVNLTAQIEGPDSEIHKILARAPDATVMTETESLAGRIRALQGKAAAIREAIT